MAGESSMYRNCFVNALNTAPTIDLAMATETILNDEVGNLEAGIEPGSVPGVNSISIGSS